MQRNIEWSLRIGLLGAERKMSVRATSNRKWHLMTASLYEGQKGMQAPAASVRLCRARGPPRRQPGERRP